MRIDKACSAIGVTLVTLYRLIEKHGAEIEYRAGKCGRGHAIQRAYVTDAFVEAAKAGLASSADRLIRRSEFKCKVFGCSPWTNWPTAPSPCSSGVADAQLLTVRDVMNELGVSHTVARPRSERGELPKPRQNRSPAGREADVRGSARRTGSTKHAHRMVGQWQSGSLQ